MTEHLTVDDLACFRAGALPAADVVRVGRHLADCRLCGDAARSAQQAGSVAEGLRRQVEGGEATARNASRWTWIAAAVAVLFVAAASVVVFRRPAPAPVRPARPQVSNPLVTQALAQGDIAPLVDLNALRPPGERVRGTDGTPVALAPAGVVIETARPRFHWTPVPNADSYVVTVQSGDREIARSGELHGAEWTPPLDLERDMTLRWQVLVTKKDGSMEEIPSPPAPPALIRVIGAQTAAELDEARRRVPADPLLVGTLEARAGLLDDARRDLAAAAKAHPGDAAIARLRDAIAKRR